MILVVLPAHLRALASVKGDVELEIDGLGILSNNIVAEPNDYSILARKK